MFYSKSTGGFYTAEIHGENIPSDAVEITSEEHTALLQGQSEGKRIVADKKGRPVLKDQLPPIKEQLAASARSEAQAYLDSTDWYFARKAETGAEVPKEVLAKRAEARVLLSS